MKYCLILFLFLQLSSITFSQWTNLGQVEDVWMMYDGVGYRKTATQIYHTSDDWNSEILVFDRSAAGWGPDRIGVWFILNENSIFVMRDFDDSFYNSMHESVNGGFNFGGALGGSYPVFGIHAHSPSRVYQVGGNKWMGYPMTVNGMPVQITSYGAGVKLNMDFTSDMIGFVIGNSYAYPKFSIFKTENGGSAWTEVLGPLSGINDINFPNQNIGYVVGDSGIIYKTVDAGDNWSLLNSPTTTDLHSVDFIDENIGFVAGENGKAYRTDNGGATWISEPISTSNNIVKINIVEYDVTYATDDSNILYKSITPLGLSEQIADSQTEPLIYPNPTNEKISVEFLNNESLVSLIVYDKMGRKLIEGFNHTIDLSHLASGNYILQISTLQGTNYHSIVRE